MNSPNLNDKYTDNTAVDFTNKKTFNWVAATTLFTVSVPVLYVIGRAYIEEYLRTYGVVIDLFQHSTQDYLFYALIGVFQTFWTTYQSLLNSWVAILVTAIYVILAAFFYQILYKNDFQNRKLRTINNRFYKSLAISLITGILFIVMSYLLLIILLSIMVIPLFIGQHSGKLSALAEIKKDTGQCALKSRKDLTACTKIIQNEKVIMIGRVIASSDLYIAVAVDGKAFILPKENLTLETM